MSHNMENGRDFTDPATYEKTRMPVSEATTLVPDAEGDAADESFGSQYAAKPT